MSADHQQLGFDLLLSASDADNEKRRQERAYTHLPRTVDEALPFYRALIQQHHAAMLAGDAATVRRLREEAEGLAFKLNNYQPGIIADDDAPGCVLARLTRAADDTIPLWGQEGSFIVTCGTMRVRIELEGIFGIGAAHMSWAGFAAHAVDWDKPFLSETGYRSFLGVGGPLEPGHTPHSFCPAVIEAYVARNLKRGLLAIAPDWRRRQPR